MDTVREIRILEGLEVRKASEEKPETLVGHAAVFGKTTRIGDLFEEVIKPGAFTRALKEGQDVRALVNHDPNRVLGRTPKTLTLSEDKEGLRVEIEPPNTTIGTDTLESVRRGDE